MTELGNALRGWRGRVGPADLGLPQDGHRRVPGLRRTELATLAGVSVEYVVQLEQGRSAKPSAQVCDALARALRLSREEHAHLLRLAGHATDRQRVLRPIPESLHRIIGQLPANPVAVFDAVWDLQYWNPLFAAVFGDPAAHGVDRPNAMVLHFEDEPIMLRQTRTERDTLEALLVADLRATAGRYPDDPAIPSLVARLEHSPRFRKLWSRPSVAGIPSLMKVVDHPEAGVIPLDCNVVTTQESGLRLLVYSPRPGSDARARLDLLGRIGTTVS